MNESFKWAISMYIVMYSYDITRIGSADLVFSASVVEVVYAHVVGEALHARGAAAGAPPWRGAAGEALAGSGAAGALAGSVVPEVADAHEVQAVPVARGELGAFELPFWSEGNW